jgi:hypothetical protein
MLGQAEPVIIGTLVLEGRLMSRLRSCARFARIVATDDRLPDNVHFVHWKLLVGIDDSTSRSVLWWGAGPGAWLFPSSIVFCLLLWPLVIRLGNFSMDERDIKCPGSHLRGAWNMQDLAGF